MLADLPPTHHQRAVAEVRAWIAPEAALPLQAGSASRLLAHPEAPARGTLVMYHGFTAGTWQYDRLARQAYDAGWDVFVPRLPGHGLKDARGVEDPSRLLTGPAWKRYLGFADETVALARALGGPVGVLGLSVGANVAVTAAERHPDVTRVAAMAPFLWPQDRRVQVLFDLTHLVDTVFPAGSGDAFNPYVMSWGEESRLETATGKRAGHSYFPGGAAYAATELGRVAIGGAPAARAPLQIYMTELDDAAEPASIRKLYDAWGGPKGLWDYPAAERVPHPMVHPQEDKGAGHTPALYARLLRFLDTGVPAVN